MAEVIRMPRLSDTMEEGNIVSWLKKVGDAVEPGDILAEVETDKATMDLESFNEGVLLHIGVEQGPVPVEGVIAIIGDKDEDIAAILKEIEEEANKSSEEAPAAPAEVTVAAPVEAKPAAVQTAAPAAPAQVVAAPSDGRIKASPLARKMAEESGIDISRIQGTGENGRIVKKDIDHAIANGVPSAPASSGMMAIPGTIDESVYGDKPLSQMRKIIARRLGESKFSAPHFYLTMEIDMGNAITAREAINEDAEIRISFNDMIVKASAAALRNHPEINASWFDDKITYHRDINIGVAVAIDEGLMVPVIRNADLKSLSMLKSEIKVLAGKARERKIQPEEMSGNTFTISNLGMFDIDEFTAIINPPDACILAVGSIVEKPVVKNGEIVVGSIMKVTLSCDHRIVDGAKGAAFLQTLKSFLENPVKILY
ncbi:MAG: pyruvate dehydrogenase complex dihydrolipoamide acetyltransferase [Saprospiraceae bacterium]|nr:pyruvate dehydrogenase complex dihydrolipoamide acetyltransferase [Bacteroidia bacterium]NNF21215.1 pyruvate dehydrogenase complex dihydrolipoamide acetyltransferase [Saprospiraceae bacterium]NNK89854.1 pyruvate dehydrogenase complex dihydrolipoamide acetyltransferase [Saprospiraceae bacterium]